MGEAGAFYLTRLQQGLSVRLLTAASRTTPFHSHIVDDSHDLDRFVVAQDDEYEQALGELESGHKRTHWMWYVFPQFDGLAFSATSKRFSIKSVPSPGSVFERLITRHFGGARDDATLGLLAQHPSVRVTREIPCAASDNC